MRHVLVLLLLLLLLLSNVLYAIIMYIIHRCTGVQLEDCSSSNEGIVTYFVIASVRYSEGLLQQGLESHHIITCSSWVRFISRVSSRLEGLGGPNQAENIQVERC